MILKYWERAIDNESVKKVGSNIYKHLYKEQQERVGTKGILLRQWGNMCTLDARVVVAYDVTPEY